MNRASISTICASACGGGNALILSYIFCKRKFDILLFICGLLSAMVSISGGCALYQPWESIIVGFIGSSISISTIPLLRVLKIDDPVNTIAIHLTPSIWGINNICLYTIALKEVKLIYRNDCGGFYCKERHFTKTDI